MKGVRKETNATIKLLSSKLEFLYKDKLKRNELLKMGENLNNLIREKKEKWKKFNEEKSILDKESKILREKVDALLNIQNTIKFLKVEYTNLQNYIEEFKFEIIEGELDEKLTQASKRINFIEEEMKELKIEKLETEFNLLMGNKEEYDRGREKYEELENSITRNKQSLKEFVYQADKIKNELHIEMCKVT